MPTYAAPLREYRFLLQDVLRIDRFANLPGFADAPLDLIEQVLEQGAKFCEEILQPLNRIGDAHGCVRHADGSVVTPPGFKAAYRQLVDAGWPALSSDPAFGGQGLPHVVALAWSEMVASSNMAFGMYPGLSHGAYEAIHTHGSDAQRQTYLPKLVSGQWTGTMNLTEPHCGTDLGMLRTKAVPQADGSYRITGQKFFISAEGGARRQQERRGRRSVLRCEAGDGPLLSRPRAAGVRRAPGQAQVRRHAAHGPAGGGVLIWQLRQARRTHPDKGVLVVRA